MKITHALLFSSLSLISIANLFAQDWPGFGGPTRNFIVSAHTNTTVPFAAWSIELGVGDAAPVVIGERIFVNEASFDENGNETIGVRCIAAKDGKTIWYTSVEESSSESQDISDKYPVRPVASLSHSAGRIVCLSYGGILSCIDATSGKLHWKHNLVKEFDASYMQYGFASSPWCDESKVVVACGGKQALLKAFQLSDGSVVWSSAPGEAAFGSIVECDTDNETKQLCYIGRDTMVGVDSESGHYLWTQPLPKQGLTNAVTPIHVGLGKLLVAGQGFDGGRLFKISRSADSYTVEESQRFARFKPFYCNVIFDSKSQQVITYNSGFLQAVSSTSGEVLWKQRNWTDSNFTLAGETLIGVRGDGYLATASLSRSGLSLIGGRRVTNDRVWTAPIIVGNFALIRGRHTLVSLDWTKLPAIKLMPAGTEVDAMNAMYGSRPEPIERMLKAIQTSPLAFTFAQYQDVANDRSLRLSENEYRDLVSKLRETNNEVAILIAEDWMKSDPDSISAFEQWADCLKVAKRAIPEELIASRMVDVSFDIVIPTSSKDNNEIFLTGNSVNSGSWKADGIKLVRSDDQHYRTSLRIPKGRFEFKITRGTWETVEMTKDGRNISNRRRMIHQPTTIQAAVQAWKS